MRRRVGHARRQAVVFAALGDQTRLALVTKLARGRPLSITELSMDSPMTRQAITKHLRVLESAGVVRCDHLGRESQFSFDPRPIDGIKGYLEEVSQQWDEALSRLKAFVER